MCVIAYCEKRQLTFEEFQNCFEINSDGVGIAYRKNGKVYVEKGLMDLLGAWKRYQKINPKGKHVVHFRITTSGGTTQELTHPFIVGKTSPIKLKYSGKKAALFHNGCLSYSWKDMVFPYYLVAGTMAEGEVSDSRFAAMLVHRLGTRALEILSGKFCVLGINKVTMKGDFQEHEGIHFSNGAYKSYYVKTTTTPKHSSVSISSTTDSNFTNGGKETTSVSKYNHLRNRNRAIGFY